MDMSGFSGMPGCPPPPLDDMFISSVICSNTIRNCSFPGCMWHCCALYLIVLFRISISVHVIWLERILFDTLSGGGGMGGMEGMMGGFFFLILIELFQVTVQREGASVLSCMLMRVLPNSILWCVCAHVRDVSSELPPVWMRIQNNLYTKDTLV